jgi:hypothetical protein
VKGGEYNPRLFAGLLALLFDPEDGGDKFFQNLDWLSVDYTALYPSFILNILIGSIWGSGRTWMECLANAPAQLQIIC